MGNTECYNPGKFNSYCSGDPNREGNMSILWNWMTACVVSLMGGRGVKKADVSKELEQLKARRTS